MAGSFTGYNHSPTLFAPGGRSLHPLQRAGIVGSSPIPNTGAAGGSVLGTAPKAAPINLGQPAHMAVVNPALGGSRNTKFMT